MIAAKEARKLILESATLKKIEERSLLEAHGLTTAADTFATVDIPNFMQSSMDGYAFKFSDRFMEIQIIGEMAAGALQMLNIGEGEATRIFTGAPLPEGADTVVMQEKISVDGQVLNILEPNLVRGQNVRLKGSEAKKGELAMGKGTQLTSAAVGFLAGIGCTHINVYAPPSVAVILTGNELQTPGNALEFGQVYEANSISLRSALKQCGIMDVEVYFAEDNREQLKTIINDALDKSDVILLCGGVSVGDYDYVVDAAITCEVQQIFHKIKQKPGKPLFFGIKGEKMVFGLPGNPSSSLTCFYEYVLPALEKIMHLKNSIANISATLTHDYPKAKGLTHFLKGNYANGQVTPLHAQESYRLQSFAQANCLIVLDEESEGGKIGDSVEVHLLPI